jgi:hypothetical protein
MPCEIIRREDWLAVMAAAKVKIEARDKVRFDAEQAAYEEKLAKRCARATETGRTPGGKPPRPPVEGPCASDQINLTDEESRIMKVAGGGFEQCYNAQAAVDVGTMLVVVSALTQAANDKEQVVPMLEPLQALPDTLGKVERLIADSGYCSEKNIAAVDAAGVEPLIALAREDHHPGVKDRFTEPALIGADAAPKDRMAHRLKTRLGRMLYALRKQTVEPVFGIIKSVMGFRQFLLRGMEKVTGEWQLVCLAWNLKRMAVLRQQSVQYG